MLKDINGVKFFINYIISMVKYCDAYGRSYFVLKEVRLRTTFASKDSGDLADKTLIDDNLATC